jgi:hypothetical protein
LEAARLTSRSRLARKALGLAGRHLVDGRWGLRRYPLAVAGLVAVGCALALSVGQVVGEHAYTAGPAAVAQVLALFVTVGASGLYAFAGTAGTYLRLVRQTPGHTRRATSVAGTASLWAAASVPATVAFGSLGGAGVQSYGGLLATIATVAILVWLAVLGLHAALPGRREPGDPR